MYGTNPLEGSAPLFVLGCSTLRFVCLGRFRLGDPALEMPD